MREGFMLEGVREERGREQGRERRNSGEIRRN